MNRQLKILLLFTQLEPAGVQTRTSYLARKFAEQGHDVEILYFYTQHSCDLGFPKMHCLLPRKPKPWQVGTKLFPALYHHLRQGSFDCAISFSHYSNSIGLTAALCTRIPVRIASQVNPPGEKQLSARILDILAGLFVYTHNVTVSEKVLSAFAHFPASYRKKLTVIHNSVSFTPSPLTPDEARKNILEKYQLTKTSRLAVSTGRLSHQKNHVALIPVLQDVENLHLIIAGEGPLRDELTRKAEDAGVAHRLHLAGNLSHAELAELYAASDLFYFPSVYEGFGLAPVEAMLSGLPVIASGLPVLCEVIGEAGILLRSGDTQAWVEATRSLLGDPQRADALRQAGRARAHLYSVDKAYGKFMALIRATLAPRSSGEASSEPRS